MYRLGKLEIGWGPINYGCRVRIGSDGPILTDIADWQPTSYANQNNRTLGSDVYKYWQIIIENGKITQYDALLDPSNHY